MRRRASLRGALCEDLLIDQSIAPVRPCEIRRLCSETLDAERLGKNNRVSVCFVRPATICRLNRRYFKRAYRTDVIAFPFYSPAKIRRLRGTLIGEVVICVDTVSSNARRYGCCFQEELCRCVIHGILHLGGYVDSPASEKRRMHARQERLLARYVTEKTI